MTQFERSFHLFARRSQDCPSPYLSVVVACHNEAEGLAELYRRAAGVFHDLLKPCELVLVNDGSSDNTWNAMRSLCLSDERVVAVALSRNFGQQAAITAGLAHARGERVLVLDADLQDPPELLPDMLELMDDGADVVHARRRKRLNETWFKRASAAAFYWLLDRLSETPIVRDTGEFRLMSRRAVDAILSLPERQRFTRGLATWIGFTQVSIEYERAGRFAGATHWPLSKMVRLAIDGITAFSTRPLALAGWLGLTVSVAGAAMLFWLLASAARMGTIDGTLGVLTAVTLLSGVQLLMLGIQGAYIGRLYTESRGRPLFFVSDVIGGASAAGERRGCLHAGEESLFGAVAFAANAEKGMRDDFSQDDARLREHRECARGRRQ